MALLNILDIAPELDEPSYWTQQRLGILNFLLDTFGENQRVTKKDHHKLTQYLNSNYKPTNKQLTDANSVMARLEGIEWNVSFLSKKQKRPRPSGLPATPKEFEAYNRAVIIWEEFWKGESTEETIRSEERLFEFLVIETAMSLGLHPKKLGNVIANLLHRPSRTTLPVSIGPDITAEQQCNLPCSARSRLISSLYVRNYGLPSDQEIHKRVSETNKHFNLTALSKHLCLIGVEPIISAQLHDSVLPINPPPYVNTFQFTGTENKQYPEVFIRPLRDIAQSKLMAWSSRAKGISDNEFNLPLAEAAVSSLKRAWRIIRQGLKINGVYNNSTVSESLFDKAFSDLKSSFINKLHEACTSSSLDKGESKKSLDYIKYLDEEAVTPIDLAYIWAKEQLLIRKNTADTLGSYFSHVFYQGFLIYTDCYSLELWEDEDTETFIYDYIISKRASINTSNQVLSEFSAVIEYAKTRLKLFSTINLNHIKEEGVVLTSRTTVLGLREFDSLITQMLKDDDATDRHKLQRACFLELAFYGGLRRHEIENLTLRDFVFNEHETLIYIRKSKTPAGIRVVPYHLLAPPYVVKRIHDFIDEKHIQHRINVRKTESSLTKYRFFDELLFSTGLLPGQNNTAQFREECINILQAYAGPGADLHLLRHSKGSHLFLWWYCARYADLIEGLSDAQHWNYSEDGLRAIRSFFLVDSDQPISGMHSNAMIHIIKTFGHSDTITFFKVYVHSFNVIASHALQRAHRIDDSFALKGKVIELVAPRAKSRTTHSKISPKTISGLAKYVFNKD